MQCFFTVQRDYFLDALWQYSKAQGLMQTYKVFKNVAQPIRFLETLWVYTSIVNSIRLLEILYVYNSNANSLRLLETFEVF